MKKFTDSHEWIEIKDNTGVVGITNFAQSELGDIVYVELPDVGRDVKKGEELVVLESTKAAADVYAPVSGKIIAVNDKLSEEANLINESAEVDGWLLKMELSEPSELEHLMNETDYKKLIQED